MSKKIFAVFTFMLSSATFLLANCPQCEYQRSHGNNYQGGGRYYYEPRYNDGYYHRDDRERYHRSREKNFQNHQDYGGNGYFSQNDREILMNIKDRLRGSEIDLERRDIWIRVKNGRVFIHGRIDSFEEKQNLEHYVMDVPKVRDVIVDVEVSEQRRWNNSNQSQSNHQRWGNGQNQTSDMELKQKIQDEISGGWFAKDYPDVNVSVSNQTVTLTGNVDSEADRKNLEEHVKSISGVQQVRNQVRVKQQSSQSEENGYYQRDIRQQQEMRNSDYNHMSRDFSNGGYSQNKMQLSDGGLKQKIKDELSGRWFTEDYPNVDVEVSNGTVTLTGSVETQNDKKDLEEKVKEIPGVKQVRNRVEIMQSSSRSNSGY